MIVDCMYSISSLLTSSLPFLVSLALSLPLSLPFSPSYILQCDNIMPNMCGPAAVRSIRVMGYIGPIFGVTGTLGRDSNTLCTCYQLLSARLMLYIGHLSFATSFFDYSLPISLCLSVCLSLSSSPTATSYSPSTITHSLYYTLPHTIPHPFSLHPTPSYLIQVTCCHKMSMISSHTELI